ncbi:hypothetical protein MRX96_017066 [Rhipicephalus microplus]|uniref:Uncharacterized protein n=1 Tax=Rhipicephalus microplus TaxID=6941 RepID=A0A9J6E7X6_RHIMP|nr:hypothetical protein HPB51_010962 [Rhipicephalus microplus]
MTWARVSPGRLEVCPRCENPGTKSWSCENPGTRFAKDVADYIRQNKSLRDLVIWDSSGGDEGAAALAKALVANDTLTTFSLGDVELSSDTLIIFAKMLATNSALESVNLSQVRPLEKDQVCWLMSQKWYAGVFKRLDIAWPEQLLPELAILIRREACCPSLFVSVTSSVDKRVLGEFTDALATDTTLRRLSIESDKAVIDALEDRFDKDSTHSACRRALLRRIWDDVTVSRGQERHLVSILDALKKNSSVVQFTTSAVMVTPEMARSLSELLAANDTLNVVNVYNYWEMSPQEIQTILKGLRTNHSLI